MSKSNQQKYFDDIIRWQQSGLSQKSWCAENGMTYSLFHYWYRRFRMQNGVKGQGVGEGFLQLRVQGGPVATPWCELLLAGGQKLSFYQMPPVEFIRALVD